MKKILLLLFMCNGVLAQSKLDFELNPQIITSNWQLSSSKWLTKAAISFNPGKTNKIRSEEGADVLVGNNSGILVSNFSAPSSRIRLEFMLDNKGELELYLAGKHKIILSQKDMAVYVKQNAERILPFQQVSRYAGLWQKLDILVNQLANGNIVIDYLKINDLVVHRGLVTDLKSAGLVSDSLSNFALYNSIGNVAVRNIEFNAIESVKNFEFKNLKYRIDPTIEWDTEELAKSPAMEGNIDDINFNFQNDYRNYVLNYTGQINVKKTDKYLISVESSGRTSFEIDGKQFYKNKEFGFGVNGEFIIPLEAGSHNFKITYQRPSWWSKALGVSVSSPSMNKYDLHDKSTMQGRYQPGEIDVPLGDKSESLRSFQIYNNKKLTQVISVGSPSGVHYSYDMGTCSPLYFWKGEFADVTEMWHERGEPQILEPKGMRISNHAKIQLSDKPNLFPTNIEDTPELVFEGYTLDKKGNPSFKFKQHQVSYINTLMPNATGGLNVSFVSDDSKLFYVRVLEDNYIEQVSRYVFKTADRYISFPRNSNPSVSTLGDKKVLVASGKGSISYNVNW